MDFVCTFCDRAAPEVGPIWPGQPMTAHWCIQDLVVEGDDLTRQIAIAIEFREVQNRVSILVNLPLDSLDKLRLREKLDEIGQIRLADTKEPAA